MTHPDVLLADELAAALECHPQLALEILRRLRDGGISATTIRNTLVHYRRDPSAEPLSTPISFKAMHFRDVYWCHRNNEPEIMGTDGGLMPVCPGCRTKWKDIEELEHDEMHVFMFHINKYLDWIERLHQPSVTGASPTE